MKRTDLQTGFTLVEMAVVLVILGLLLGGVLAPLQAQKEQERRDRNEELLEQARQALLGFAIVNGRLPCPDTDSPGSADSGKENPGCSTADTTINRGRLPWVTLGLNGRWDPWGEPHQIHYAVNGDFVATIGLDSTGSGNGIIEVHRSAGSCGSSGQLVAANVPALVWSTAATDYASLSPSRADEAENADGDRCYVYRAYSSVRNAEFDDQMVWLSPNVLFNRLISAGKLP